LFNANTIFATNGLAFTHTVHTRSCKKSDVMGPSKYFDASSDVDTCVEAGRLLVADLYDPKGSAKSVHRDLNKLRVKLALSKDSSLVKLPPSEAATVFLPIPKKDDVVWHPVRE
jgi:hypothetical protein